MYDHIYYKNPAYECIQDGEKVVCINWETGNWIKLNESGVMLLDRIGNKSFADILSDISSEMSFSEEMTKQLFEPVFKQLITSKLIITKEKTPLIIEEDKDSHARKNYPQQIWIHVTDTCNLGCPFCYYKAKGIGANLPVTNINKEKLFEFLFSIPEEQRETITISGGEPFLNEDLPCIVKTLKEDLHFNFVMVISNGTVRHDLYDKVIPYVDYLQISIDGISPEKHEKTRGKNTFALMKEGISKAQSVRRGSVRLSYTVTADNVSELPELAQFAFEQEVNSIHINKLMRVGKNIANEARISPELLKEKIECFKKNVYEYNSKINYIREILEVGNEDRRKFITYSNSFNMENKIEVAGRLTGCGLGAGMISIDADGTIYACPSLHNPDFVIGSLEEGYDDAVRRGREMSSLYDVDNEKMECKACKYRYFCGGGCRAEALAAGNIYGKYEQCVSFCEALINDIKEY